MFAVSSTVEIFLVLLLCTTEIEVIMKWHAALFPPQAALNCSTSPFLSAALWIVPRIVLSLSQLSAACLVTRDTVYLHTGKPFMLNRSRSCLLFSEEFKKSWTTKFFLFLFLNAEIFTSCLNLAETSFTEHVFKKEANLKSVDKRLESQIPVWKVDTFILCAHTCLQ